MPKNKERLVLVVDDELAVCRLLARIIGKTGWGAVTAASGQEALDQFEPGKFALVISDVDLGEGPNGIAIVLKLLERQPGLRVVLMSGDSINEDQAKKAGLRFIQKPFDLSVISALLE